MIDELTIRYIDLAALVRWDRNPKRHDLGSLAASIVRHGFKNPPRYEPTLNDGMGGIVAGNGRADALSAMKAQGQSAPRGIRADGDTWYVPVLFGVDAESQAAAEAYGVDDNNLTMAGGDFTDLDMAKLWDADGYAALLEDLAHDDQSPVSIDETALDALLTALHADAAGPEHTIAAQPNMGYDFRAIHPLKLAYRVEAAWRANDGVALDLFSGEGQLVWWYQRRFDHVIRVDAEAYDGIDVVMKASDYLASDAFCAIANTITFVDFDDEGSPLREVRAFFAALPEERTDPFVLCITDGSVLPLKLHGWFSPELYDVPGDVRRATTDDYERFHLLVQDSVERAALAHGWYAACWSSTRGSDGNVFYGTFGVTRAPTDQQTTDGHETD